MECHTDFERCSHTLFLSFWVEPSTNMTLGALKILQDRFLVENSGYPSDSRSSRVKQNQTNASLFFSEKASVVVQSSPTFLRTKLLVVKSSMGCI